MTLYERIRARREELQVSQDELANVLGYKDRSSISKIEAGKSDIPQSKIEAFAKALETTPAYLMGWTNNPSRASIGERIRARRESLGMSVKEVSEKIGIPEETIYRYESADVLEMNILYIDAVADVLQTTSDYFFGRTNNPENKNYFDLSGKNVVSETEKKFLLLARDAEKLPPEEKQQLMEDMERTMRLYLKSIGRIKED